MSQEWGLPGQPAGRWPSAPPAAGTTDQGRPKRPRETDAAVGLMMLQAVFGVATVLILAVTGSLTQQSTADTPPGVSGVRSAGGRTTLARARDRSRPHGTAALRQLVLQTPAPVVAGVLGVHDKHTARVVADAGGTSNRYARGDHH